MQLEHLRGKTQALGLQDLVPHRRLYLPKTETEIVTKDGNKKTRETYAFSCLFWNSFGQCRELEQGIKTLGFYSYFYKMLILWKITQYAMFKMVTGVHVSP